MVENDIETGAVFSACRKYRYKLWRIWNPEKPLVLFIGLNPSTADEKEDCPTIRRCINFAKDWNFGGVVVTNLFSFCATKSADLFDARDPVGPDTDKWITRLTTEADLVVAAWGNHGSRYKRSLEIRKLVHQMKCFNINKSGEPVHPLYQRKDAELINF